MPIETFRTNYPDGTPHKLSGRLLNRQGGVLNAVTHAWGIQVGVTGVAGGYGGIPPGQAEIAMAIVTDIADTCPELTSEGDGKGWPCRSKKKYLVKVRNHDHGDGSWGVFNNEERELDLGEWWPPDVTSGPILLVDDILPVLLDKHRGRLVALGFPTVRAVILTTELASNGTATAKVLKRSAGTTWASVTGVTLTVADMSLNSVDDPWPVGVKGLAVWIVDTWLFVPLSCEADDTGIT